MALVTWTDNLSVQNAEMDNQHQQWIGLINQMHDAMLVGKGRDSVKPIIQAVVDYTHTHFTQEERLLQKHHYPDFLPHQQLHQDFVQQLQEMLLDLEQGKVYSVDVMKILKDWLLAHIKTVDSQYGVYLHGIGIQ